MNSEGLNFLGRIAEALERQVQQTDEAVERHERWRNENLQMRDKDNTNREREREAELCEAREANRQSIAVLREAARRIDHFSVRLSALESALSVPAGATSPEAHQAESAPDLSSSSLLSGKATPRS